MRDAASQPDRPAPNLWRGLLLAGIIPLALLAVALWLGIQFDAMLRSHIEVDQSYRQQSAISSLLSTIKDAETGQRGYVITGDRSFLTPYAAARTNVPVRLSELDRLFDARSPVHANVGRIRHLVPLKFREMEAVLATRDRDGLAAAAAMVAAGRGKSLMDQIRHEASAVERYENARLAHTILTARTRAVEGERAYLYGGILVALIAFLAVYLIWKGQTSRHKAMLDSIDASTRQTAIFRSAVNAIVLINPSGSIEVMNPSAERMFGFAANDLLRRDIAIIADLAPGDGPFLERIGFGPDGLAQPYRTLVSAHCADGSLLPVDVALGLMPLDDGMHIVAVFTDISEREKAEQIKDQFLSTVSHELRTPLTSIVGSLGLLKVGALAEMSEQSRRLVVIAENNANRLIRIVNDLLDAEKLQSGQMTFALSAVDMRDVAAASVEAMGGLAGSRGVSLRAERAEQPIIVRGDAERLIQVTGNLLSNAIKFSPSGGEVEVTCCRNGDSCRMIVADRGPGIPDELRARLFTRFAQASGHGAPGTGLGLSIARDIVHQHDGTIGFDDNPAGGTLFHFDLPLLDSPARQEELGTTPCILLFLQTEEAARLKAVFERQGVETEAVQSIPDALSLIRKHRYLAMVADIHCVGPDLPTLLRTAEDKEDIHRLPVIAIAREGAAADADGLAKVGIMEWIQRPADGGSVDDAVEAAVARAVADMPIVLHLDDDPDTLNITAAALSGLARVAQATDLASARSYLAHHTADILIVDIALPDGSGTEIVTELGRVQGASPPIIIYSAQDFGAVGLRNVEAVLTKSKKSLPMLVEAIFAVRDRQKQEPLS
ncbi:MAG TPA: CHASE3 domain-containing protein [Sphingobium sp.]